MPTPLDTLYEPDQTTLEPGVNEGGFGVGGSGGVEGLTEVLADAHLGDCFGEFGGSFFGAGAVVVVEQSGSAK